MMRGASQAVEKRAHDSRCEANTRRESHALKEKSPCQLSLIDEATKEK